MPKATVFHLEKDRPNLKRLPRVVEALEKGDAIIYPTDTVYGLACDPLQKKAIDKIQTIKNLGPRHLFSFICCDISQAAAFVDIDNNLFPVLKRILPGPYTIILEANKKVPKVLLQDRKEVGIRVPDSAVAQFLSQNLGRPFLSTSVVDYNGNTILDPEEMVDIYGERVAYIIEQGFIGDDVSTVLKYIDGTWEIIREGKGPVDFLAGI
ncbi:threonylcarbamoyl-AMP synthase [Myxococcota bacterium]|nr:threonylcarbamoyl-AMP synthase [Myxococcota bacterium]MBU1381100.1 threonylcarbamoyl-AMP synthase [Myxococcota bacterium]MBU1498225.1 threonylcarbamoyl-AMP synthase [Myxococcota bacterium]